MQMLKRTIALVFQTIATSSIIQTGTYLHNLTSCSFSTSLEALWRLHSRTMPYQENDSGGTLRLMMANPISRALILLTKFLGSYLSFVISLIPVLIGVILLLYLQPDLHFSSSDWRAAIFLFLLAMLYLCPIFMLGRVCFLCNQRPQNNAHGFNDTVGDIGPGNSELQPILGC